jgi:glutathione S-transferase
MKLALILFLFWLSVALCGAAAGPAPVYVMLWFDTEDYVDPIADDAALRIAQDLDRLGVRATFKVVGEKARVLEARGRRDVIRALAHHDIGYHSDYHSFAPAPSLYLRDLGWLDGAGEFYRRERQGAADVRRIFGVTPSCYGQPGSSWGPQSYPALLRMGIPVYLDEATSVGLDSQPFWLSGMLHVFNMGRFLIRPSLDDESKATEQLQQFDRDVEELGAHGGGVISTYYHPTEFVHTEFWDAVNFAKGASRERSAWQLPNRRTPAEAERCFRVLTRYVEHAKKLQNVRFITARDLPLLYESAIPRPADRAKIAEHLAARQTFLVTEDGALSAADMLLALLGVDPQDVEGPASRQETTWRAPEIPRWLFERAKTDTASFIRANHRLPPSAWLGSERLSLADFAATLAADRPGAPVVTLRKGNPEMERYVSTDAAGSFSWLIHPEGFSAPSLLELARLQAWTLKPARLH